MVTQSVDLQGTEAVEEVEEGPSHAGAIACRDIRIFRGDTRCVKSAASSLQGRLQRAPPIPRAPGRGWVRETVMVPVTDIRQGRARARR